jgi:regulatory protein
MPDRSETEKENTSVEAAKRKALSLLDRRDYSRAELLRKLDEKGYDAAAAEEAVDRLVYLGFVDDARYAPIVVRHYAAKGYGAQRIRGELQRRGIPKELWDTAMAEMPQQDETLDRLLRSRLKGAPACDRDALRKATDALRRKGYGWDEISAAVERMRAEEE